MKTVKKVLGVLIIIGLCLDFLVAIVSVLLQGVNIDTLIMMIGALCGVVLFWHGAKHWIQGKPFGKLLTENTRKWE